MHVHLHDVRGSIDHLPPGKGDLDLGKLLTTFQRVGYKGALCWELNPDRATPADIRNAARFTRTLLADGHSK